MKISNANVGPKKKNINPPIKDNKTDKIDKIIKTIEGLNPIFNNE